MLIRLIRLNVGHHQTIISLSSQTINIVNWPNDYTLLKGKAMISSYDCPLMQELYGRLDYDKVSIKEEQYIRSGKVQEVIWMNYKPRSTQSIF